LNILAIETSTEACSAALLINGEIEERYEVAPRGHGDLILQMVDDLLAHAALKPQQLTAIAFGRGPGAFTGVRIATSVVQGIALGADLPVVQVSTLAALAQGAYRQHQHRALLCAMDARMGEVYWGCYAIDDGIAVAQAEECVCKPEAAPVVIGDGWQGIGTGWQAYGDVLSQRYGQHVTLCDAAALPRAWDIAVLAERGYRAGQAVSAEQALPVYLRDNVVSRP
jgi:tRNA threonylcarbamoyladenosine biosynthesis protein TsaB